jgi:integrase/recombinase XerD
MVRGVRKQWSLETDDPKIAKARRNAVKERAVADVHGDAVRSFEEVFSAWEAQLLRSVGRKTAQRYLCSLAQLDQWLEGKMLHEIDGRLVAEIIRERQKAGVTNATIKRDLGALSSVFNYAILQGWAEANPVLAKLALVPERRDPIVLPLDRDIALVMQHAPGMVAEMMRAALLTGAREEELAKAKRAASPRVTHSLARIGLAGNAINRILEQSASRR